MASRDLASLPRFASKLSSVLLKCRISVKSRCHRNLKSWKSWAVLYEFDRFSKIYIDGPYGSAAQDHSKYDVMLLIGLGIGATPFISILKDIVNDEKTRCNHVIWLFNHSFLFFILRLVILFLVKWSLNERVSRFDLISMQTADDEEAGKTRRASRAYFYWVTREQGSFAWFKSIMNEVAELDKKVRRLENPVDFHLAFKVWILTVLNCHLPGEW